MNDAAAATAASVAASDVDNDGDDRRLYDTSLKECVTLKGLKETNLKLTTGVELKTVRFDQSVNKGIGERSLQYRKSKGKRKGKGMNRPPSKFAMQEATLYIA
jgi:hypothetical protein